MTSSWCSGSGLDIGGASIVPRNRLAKPSDADPERLECKKDLSVSTENHHGRVSDTISEVVRGKPGSSGDASEHSWPDFILVVEGKDEVLPAFTGKDAVRSAFVAFDRPSRPQERSEDTFCF